MKKLTYVLLIAGACLLVLAACAPALTNTSPESEEPVVAGVASAAVDPTWTGGEFTAYAMTMAWDLWEEDTTTDLNFFHNGNIDVGGAVCKIGFSPLVLSEATPHDLAAALGHCLHESWLEVPRGDNPEPWRHVAQDWKLYSTVYADAYVAQCGETYEPLHWGNASDGACELPDPVQVARDYYNWEDDS